MRRYSLILLLCILPGCRQEIRINVVEPGHFHAGMVLRERLEGVSDTVDVYGPEGKETEAFLEGVRRFNSRAENATSWITEVHTGVDLPIARRAFREVVVLAGKNSRKTENILDAVSKGYNVLSDKPMAIEPGDFPILEKACEEAAEKGLAVMDLMTERHDELNIATKRLLEGRILTGGTGESPGIEMESIHHFYKEVDGVPLTRPVWYYDVKEQGEGIADVTTHLIDLVLWQCFPGEAIRPDEVEVLEACHYPTVVTPEQFLRSTGEVIAEPLEVLSNGQVLFKVRDLYVRISVRWDYEGGPDTFQAVYRCEGGNIYVRQDSTTGYAKKLFDGETDVTPRRVLTHEDHFSLVAADFLRYVRRGRMPASEIQNTLSKYYITTTAVQMASE